MLAAENGDYSEAVEQAELAMMIFGPLFKEKLRMTLAATVIGSAEPLPRQPAGGQARLRTGDGAAGCRARRPAAMTAAMNNLALLKLGERQPEPRAGA